LAGTCSLRTVFLACGIDDLELGLSACVGPDILDPLSIGTEPRTGSAAGRPQLAVTPDFGVAPVAKEVRSRFAVACDALSQIADVEEVSPDCGGAIEAFRTLRAAHVADSYGALLRDRRAELTPIVI
jgi:amidase